MTKNKVHKANIKAWKNQQEEKFLKSIPFAVSIFQDLFDHLDIRFETKSCTNTFNLTIDFLASKGIHFEDHIDFFIEHGSGCDCEVLANMEEMFPERKSKIPIKRETAAKREKVNSIDFEGFRIDKIPAPWRLFKTGNDYVFQLGKNQDIKIDLVKNANIQSWNDNNYWKSQWEATTELKVTSSFDLIYDEIEGFETVTFTTKEWTPVLTWIRKPGNDSWILIFKTELSRFRGDIRELKNLVKKIT